MRDEVVMRVEERDPSSSVCIELVVDVPFLAKALQLL